jgi:hypothetical protein
MPLGQGSGVSDHARGPPRPGPWSEPGPCPGPTITPAAVPGRETAGPGPAPQGAGLPVDWVEPQHLRPVLGHLLVQSPSAPCVARSARAPTGTPSRSPVPAAPWPAPRSPGRTTSYPDHRVHRPPPGRLPDDDRLPQDRPGQPVRPTPPASALTFNPGNLVGWNRLIRGTPIRPVILDAVLATTRAGQQQAPADIAKPTTAILPRPRHSRLTGKRVTNVSIALQAVK